MNIGQNLLDAFDIMLDKRFTDLKSTATSLVIAEIASMDIFSNTYSILYQGETYDGVLANNNTVYSLGDIVQVITNNNDYVIVGRVSSSGAQAVYTDYIAQLSVNSNVVASENSWTTKLLYDRKTKTYNGLSETDVSNFNKAVKEAQRAVLNAYINFDAPSATTCSIIAIFNSVAYQIDHNNKTEEVIKASTTIELNFTDLIGTSQLNQSKLYNFEAATGGEWVLESFSLTRGSADLTIDITSITLNLESDHQTVSNRISMSIDAPEGTEFTVDGAKELTFKAVLKNAAGGYFSAPRLRFLWGGADPTIIAADTNRYNAFLGEGWAPLNEPSWSSAQNVTVDQVPVWNYYIDKNNIQTAAVCSREIKCVALLPDTQGKDTVIASATIEVTNAQENAEYSINLDTPAINDYPDTSISPVEVTASVSLGGEFNYYWIASATDGTKTLIADNDSAIQYDASSVNLFTTILCSVYQGDKYIGTNSAFVYASKEIAEGDITKHARAYILTKRVNQNTIGAHLEYFNTLTWYASKNEAQKHAYNGINLVTKDKSHSEDILFGYYMWEKVYIKKANGLAYFEYHLVDPKIEWEKDVLDIKDYYQLSNDIPEPIDIDIITSDDGHDDISADINLNGWSNNTELEPTETITKEWKCTVTYYTDGSAAVGEITLIDMFISADIDLSNSFQLKRHTFEWNVNGNWVSSIDENAKPVAVRAKLEYASKGNGDSPVYSLDAEKGYDSIKYQWSDDNKEAPEAGEEWSSEVDYNGTGYLWAKIGENAAIIIATTLSSARHYLASESGIQYQASTSQDGLIDTAWTNNFEDVAKQISEENGLLLWKRACNIYETLYWSDSVNNQDNKGKDTLYTKPTSEIGDSAVLAWAAAGNTTFMNGSKIYTGSIEADKLNVATLNAVAADIAGWKIGPKALYKDEDIFLSTGNYIPQDKAKYQRIAVGGKSAPSISEIQEPIIKENLILEDWIESNQTRGKKTSFSFIACVDNPQLISNQSSNALSQIVLYNLSTDEQITISLIEKKGQLTGIYNNSSILTVKLVNHTSGAPRYNIILELQNFNNILIEKCIIYYQGLVVPGLEKPVFQVLSDGSMYAESGSIAGWKLTEDGLFTNGKFNFDSEDTIIFEATNKDFEYTGLTSGGSNLVLSSSGDWTSTQQEKITLENTIENPAYFAEIEYEESFTPYSSQVDIQEDSRPSLPTHWYSIATPSISASVVLKPLRDDLKSVTLSTATNSGGTTLEGVKVAINNPSWSFGTSYNLWYEPDKNRSDYTGWFVYLRKLAYSGKYYNPITGEFQSYDLPLKQNTAYYVRANRGGYQITKYFSLPLGTEENASEFYIQGINNIKLEAYIFTPSNRSEWTPIKKMSTPINATQRVSPPQNLSITLTNVSNPIKPNSYLIDFVKSVSTKKKYYVIENGLYTGKTEYETFNYTKIYGSVDTPVDYISNTLSIAQTELFSNRLTIPLINTADSKASLTLTNSNNYLRIAKYTIYKAYYFLKISKIKLYSARGRIKITLPAEQMAKEDPLMLQGLDSDFTFETLQGCQATLSLLINGIPYSYSPSPIDQNNPTASLSISRNTITDPPIPYNNVNYEFIIDVLDLTKEYKLEMPDRDSVIINRHFAQTAAEVDVNFYSKYQNTATNTRAEQETDKIILIKRTVKDINGNTSTNNLMLLDAEGRFEIESNYGFSIKKTQEEAYLRTQKWEPDVVFQNNDVYFGSKGIRIGNNIVYDANSAVSAISLDDAQETDIVTQTAQQNSLIGILAQRILELEAKINNS